LTHRFLLAEERKGIGQEPSWRGEEGHKTKTHEGKIKGDDGKWRKEEGDNAYRESIGCEL